MQKKHAPVHAPVQNYDNDDDDGDCDDDDDNDEFDCHRLLLDGEEIICPDCAKEKLMGPQAQ